MRWKTLGAGLLVVVGIGAAVLAVVRPSFGGTAATQYLTSQATVTDVVEQIAATGTIEAGATYDLAFGSAPSIASSSASAASAATGASWTVKTVAATAGQAVKAGDVLATADTSSAELDLAVAEANLLAAQARLSSDKGGLSAPEKASALLQVTQARQQLAKSFSRLGQAVVNRGRPSEAVAYLEHSCRILREITATTSKNGRLRSELALAVTRLAEALSAQGQTQAALTQLAEAVGLNTQLRREFPEDRRSPHNLVLTYQLMGEIHDGDAVAHSGQERLAARQAAKDNYQNALDILLGLREQQALAAFDRTLLEKMQAAVAKHH